MIPKVDLLGVRISNVNMEESVDLSLSLLDEESKHLIFTPNANLMVKAVEDDSFTQVLGRASLLLPDGMSLVLISKILGTPIKGKVSGSTYFIDSLRAFSKKEVPVFLVGSSNKVLELVKRKIESEISSANIVGYYSPPISFEKDESLLADALKKMKEYEYEVLYLALSDGRGERFLARYIEELPAKIGIQVGAALDFYSGEKKSIPDFFKRLGIGWLWRLIHEPQKMYKRYFLHDIRIFKYAMKTKLLKK